MSINPFHIGAFLKLLAGLLPGRYAPGNITGPAINRRHFASCVLHVASGPANGGPAPTQIKLDAKIQHAAASAGPWVDFVPHMGAAAITRITAANAEAHVDVNLLGAKEWIRVVAPLAFDDGTTPTLDVSATVCLGASEKVPTEYP
jgi:hypothetical protein